MAMTLILRTTTAVSLASRSWSLRRLLDWAEGLLVRSSTCSARRSQLTDDSLKNFPLDPQLPKLKNFIQAFKKKNGSMFNPTPHHLKEWCERHCSATVDLAKEETYTIPFVLDYLLVRYGFAWFFFKRHYHKYIWTTTLGYFRSLEATIHRRYLELSSLTPRDGAFDTRPSHVPPSGWDAQNQHAWLSYTYCRQENFRLRWVHINYLSF